jgi:hypothetical protein
MYSMFMMNSVGVEKMKYLFGSLIVLLCVSLSAMDVFQCDRSSGDQLNISFTLPTYQITASKDNPSLSRIIFNDAEIDKEAGSSGDLPQFGRFMHVPEGCIVQVTIDSAIYDTIKSTHFYEAEPIVSNAIRSDKFIEVGETGICRNLMIAPICVKPFLYEPVTGDTRVLKQVSIHVKFLASPEGKYFGVRPALSKSWMNLANSLILNPSNETPRAVTLPGSYVIFYNGGSVLTTIQSLIDWKHRKGYDVHVVNTGTGGTVSNTTTAIKNYLQNAYNTWPNPPEYILLVGDASGTTSIPTYTNHFSAQPNEFDTVGDNDYTKLSGTDDYPDAFIGRLCFASTTELSTEVNRIINYEKNLNATTDNWYERTLLVGDASNSGTSTQTTALYIWSLISDYNPNQGFTEVYSGNFPSQINNAINQGVSAYYYRGFGDFSGYTTQSFSGLVNNNKYPVITYITCFGGDYANANIQNLSQAERFMIQGTANQPKGAIAVYAPSSETHTCFNNLLTGAFAYGLYKDGDVNPGQAVLHSKLALIANYPSNPQNYVKQYLMADNLLGDPSTELWLKQPKTIQANFPLSTSPGDGSVMITVHDNQNVPITDAWVCLQKGADEIFVSGYTDDAGQVVLSYSGATSGSCNITITKQHYMPLLNTITIGTVHANAEFSNIEVSSPFQAGTTTSFQLKIKNYTSGTISGLTADITTNNPYVSIQTASSSYPVITSGAEGLSLSNYSLHIDATCPKGSNIPITLTIHDGMQTYVSNFGIRENGLLFQIDSVQIGTSGNIINPGATQPLILTIQNLSLWNAIQIHTELISPYTMITFPTGSQVLASIPSGTSYTNTSPYQIQVGNEATNGQFITLDLHLFTDNGWEQYIPFNIQIGQATLNDPTGPDTYGYYCIESRDTGSPYTPVYQWIELDPTYGGTGTNLSLSDTDVTGSGVYTTISIPFNFKFYGQLYDHVTVTSNGYIMPGMQGSVEWMNWSIPGSMVPKPIIAPFWDDLVSSSGGKVLYQYHPELHAMIIEWSRMRNSYNTNTVETFAAWLHDAPADTAVSSDNAITFQYNTISNVDAGNYIGEYLNHGEYATVGIADNSGMIGLQYTYSNVYPSSARTLANQTALRFVSINPVTVNPRPVIASMSLSDPTGNNNNEADFGETVNINLNIRNQGQAELPVSNLSLSSSDQYITLINSTSTLPAIAYFQNAALTQPFQVQLSANVPNLHTIPLNLHIENSQGSYDLQFAIVAHAPNIVLQSALFTDNNNGYPEPGESVALSISLKNTSEVSLLQGTVYPIFPEQWIVNPVNQVVDFTSGVVVPVTFQVQIPATYPIGAQCTYQLQIQSGSFTWTQPQNLIVGVPTQIFETNLDLSPSTVQWALQSNVVIQDAQYIHTTGKEAVFNGDWNGAYLITPVLNANDLQALNIKFNYMNLNQRCQYGCIISWDGMNWETVWSDTVLVTEPTVKSISIATMPSSWILYVGFFAASYFQVPIGPFVVDDIYIAGIHHAPGYFQGHVSLDGGDGDVTQVEIMAYPDFNVVHPDADGNYSLPAYQGEYPTVLASLPGYQWAQQDSVSVIMSQATTLNEMVLQYYQPIMNLTDTVVGNTVTLQWTLGRDITLKIAGRSIAPTQYKVHIRKNNLNFTDTTTNTQYTHALFGSGAYTFYVVAEFYFQGQLVYSDSSNVITENIVGNSDPVVPAVTRLNQNYPNPFTGKTFIQYDLAKASRSFKLEIFNVKGQCIRTLDKGNKSPGTYSIEWDGKDSLGKPAASGMYFYKMECENQKWVKKAILLR